MEITRRNMLEAGVAALALSPIASAIPAPQSVGNQPKALTSILISFLPPQYVAFQNPPIITFTWQISSTNINTGGDWAVSFDHVPPRNEIIAAAKKATQSLYSSVGIPLELTDITAFYFGEFF